MPKFTLVWSIGPLFYRFPSLVWLLTRTCLFALIVVNLCLAGWRLDAFRVKRVHGWSVFPFPCIGYHFRGLLFSVQRAFGCFGWIDLRLSGHKWPSSRIFGLWAQCCCIGLESDLDLISFWDLYVCFPFCLSGHICPSSHEGCCKQLHGPLKTGGSVPCLWLTSFRFPLNEASLLLLLGRPFCPLFVRGGLG